MYFSSCLHGPSFSCPKKGVAVFLHLVHALYSQMHTVTISCPRIIPYFSYYFCELTPLQKRSLILTMHWLSESTSFVCRSFAMPHSCWRMVLV